MSIKFHFDMTSVQYKIVSSNRTALKVSVRSFLKRVYPYYFLFTLL